MWLPRLASTLKRLAVGALAFGLVVTTTRGSAPVVVVACLPSTAALPPLPACSPARTAAGPLALACPAWAALMSCAVPAPAPALLAGPGPWVPAASPARRRPALPPADGRRWPLRRASGARPLRVHAARTLPVLWPGPCTLPAPGPTAPAPRPLVSTCAVPLPLPALGLLPPVLSLRRLPTSMVSLPPAVIDEPSAPVFGDRCRLPAAGGATVGDGHVVEGAGAGQLLGSIDHLGLIAIQADDGQVATRSDVGETVLQPIGADPHVAARIDHGVVAAETTTSSTVVRVAMRVFSLPLVCCG